VLHRERLATGSTCEWSMGTHKSDSVPVGNVTPIFPGDPEVLDNDGESGSNPQSDGGVSRGRRNWEFGARHSSGNRCPCGDGRGAVGTSIVVLREDDTPGCGSEQDEESDVEEDCNEGSEKLGDELVPWLGTEEVTRLKITGHIRSLGSRTSGHDTSG